MAGQPAMVVPQIRGTVFGLGLLDGMPMDFPVTDHGLDLIYALLRNGRNVKVTLHKDDGSWVEYTLPD